MKKLLHFTLVVIVTVVAYNFSLIKYGLGQAYGQLSIVWQAEPIDEFVARPSTPDSVKQKLQFVEEVRQFAVDFLGLNDSDNYTTIYDQGGEPVLWVVTGCKPYKLEAKEWKFPVLGSVPYKGFFNIDLATKEMLKVKEEGYDAGIRTVGGWSTLGWFNDPILSNMLHRSDGELANLIIHELVHATVFVRDSVEFNENLASFIGDKSAVEFMKVKFGRNSTELNKYLDEQHDERKYINHILGGVDRLEALYTKLEGASDSAKQIQKDKLIGEIMMNTDTLSLKNSKFLNFLKGQHPNNTYFMSFMRYRSKQDALDSLYSNKFNKQIKPFVAYMKEKYPYL